MQRGMYFRPPPGHGVILMSRRPGALYDDALSSDESVLTYEGHDAKKTLDLPAPKSVDQPRSEGNGKPTQNGQFADWTDRHKSGVAEPARFRVYEKIRNGIWTDRGIYLLEDYRREESTGRFVFKYILHQADFDLDERRSDRALNLQPSRQIPSWVKQIVFKRDHGKCVICEATDQLHFDHDLPFSKGGTSVVPENVRILCARHNLSKSDKIE